MVLDVWPSVRAWPTYILKENVLSLSQLWTTVNCSKNRAGIVCTNASYILGFSLLGITHVCRCCLNCCNSHVMLSWRQCFFANPLPLAFFISKMIQESWEVQYLFSLSDWVFFSLLFSWQVVGLCVNHHQWSIGAFQVRSEDVFTYGYNNWSLWFSLILYPLSTIIVEDYLLGSMTSLSIDFHPNNGTRYGFQLVETDFKSH